MYLPEGYTKESLAELFRTTENADVEISIGSTILGGADVVTVDIQELMTDGGVFGIGSFPARQLTMTVIAASLPKVFLGLPLTVKFKAGDVAIPMGVFYADPSNVVTTEGVTTSIVAYDAAYYLTGTYVPKISAWPATAKEVLDDILSQQGTLKLDSNWNASLDYDLTNTVYIQNLAITATDENGESAEVQYVSYREAIAQVALCLGANAFMDRNGELTFRRVLPSPEARTADITLTTSDYPSLGFTRGSNEPIRFDRLEAQYIHDVTTESTAEEETVSETVSVTDTFTYTASDKSSNSLTIQSNDLRTQALTDTFGKAMLGTTGLSYQPYTVTCVDGYPFLDLTDSITLTDYQGVEWAGLPIFSASHTYSGAFVSSFGAAALADIDASLGASVSLQSQLATVSAKVSQNGRAMMNFISAANAQFDKVTANTAAIGKLDTNYVRADKANITEAWIKDLMIQGKMVAQDGAVYNLTGLHINAGDITAGTLSVDRLAVKGEDNEYYVLTPKADGSGYDSAKIDGSIIAKNSINADRITANSITTDQLTVNNLGSTNGWINLAKGTFAYTNPDNGAGISWDGKKLTINADSIQMGGVDAATKTDLNTTNGNVTKAQSTADGAATAAGKAQESVDTLETMTDKAITFDTSYTFSSANDVETANFEAHVYRYGEDVTSEFADSCFSWWRKLEGERTSGDMIRFATGKTCTVSLADCGYGATVVGQFETAGEASLLTTSSARLQTLDAVPLTAAASGEYVRVSDLPTGTPQSDDWLMGWSAASTYKATMRNVVEASMQVATKSEIEEALA